MGSIAGPNYNPVLRTVKDSTPPGCTSQFDSYRNKIGHILIQIINLSI